MKNIGTTHWLLTDTHFFHQKMYEYCNRPVGFEKLIQDGLNIIGDNDVLIHLGDICIGDDEKAHEEFIKPLKCKKWLVKGNHDGKSDTWYLNHGWDFVSEGIVFKKFGKKILLTHISAKDGDYDLNIHGHEHNGREKSGKITYKNSKNRLLAIEYTDYKPVKLMNMVDSYDKILRKMRVKSKVE